MDVKILQKTWMTITTAYWMRTTRAPMETWAGFQVRQLMLMATDAEILLKIQMAEETLATTLETILVTTPHRVEPTSVTPPWLDTDPT